MRPCFRLTMRRGVLCGALLAAAVQGLLSADPALARGRAPVKSSVEVRYRDLVQVTDGSRAEWVEISGTLEVAAKIRFPADAIIPPDPVIPADPIRGTAELKIRAKDLRAVGQTTGAHYALKLERDDVNLQTPLDVPGRLELPVNYLLARRPGRAIPADPIRIELQLSLTGEGVLADAAAAPVGSQVSAWRAEGDASDEAGLHPGTLVGAVGFVAGQRGAAFEFGAEPSHVEIARSAALEPATLTVAAWVRSPGPSNGVRFIVFNGEAGICGTGSYSLFSGDGALVFSVATATGAVVSSGADPLSVWDGTWHHVTGTYDAARVALYVDGALIGAGTPAGGPIAYSAPGTGADRFQIGGSCSSSAVPGDDQQLILPLHVDEVHFFSRALEAAEVENLYRSER